MLMMIVTENNVMVETGTPLMFVTDDMFDKLLKNPNKAISLRNTYGRNLCLGRLGELDNEGVYAEKAPNVHAKYDDCEEGVFFYDYI